MADPAYTTAEAVYQTLLNIRDFGQAARIQVDDVKPYIVGIEGRVNGLLRNKGYTVPITSEVDIALIGEMVRKEAAVQLYYTLHMPQRAPDWAKAWKHDFESWLEDLRQGHVMLAESDPQVY